MGPSNMDNPVLICHEKGWSKSVLVYATQLRKRPRPCPISGVCAKYVVTVNNTNDGRTSKHSETRCLLSNGNIRLQLATPEICQARNLSRNPKEIEK